MDKKMTSGEIAKKVGVSQKAIRLYDEKGLLKPADYSEGNYRLYDKESILVLEKIIALKHIGFTLEEIYDNLVVGKNMDIVESLNQQLEIMEQKKSEIQKTIDCIQGILARTDGQPDWSDVAEIARNIRQDQSADEEHFYALKHTANTMDWYECIYDMLDINVESLNEESLNTNTRVLDIGCGFGKLWRNNWSKIPEGITINGIDLHGSWADDFQKFINENKNELSNNTSVSLYWGDVENEDIWDEVSNIHGANIENSSYDNYYDYIIAHYIIENLNNADAFLQRVTSVMKKGAIFSCNAYQVMDKHFYWKEIFKNLNLKDNFIKDKIKEEGKCCEDFKLLLEKYFEYVEIQSLDNSMRYYNVDEVFEKLCKTYPENIKYIKENERVIKAYFEDILQENGEIIVNNNSEFWRCLK